MTVYTIQQHYLRYVQHCQISSCRCIKTLNSVDQPI